MKNKQHRPLFVTLLLFCLKFTILKEELQFEEMSYIYEHMKLSIKHLFRFLTT